MNLINTASSFTEEEVIAFLKKNVGSYYSKDVFYWEYFSFSQESIFKTLRDESGKIFATQGHIIIELLSPENKSIVCNKAETAFAVPEIRGKGIFDNFYKETIQESISNGVKFFWGFTALSGYFESKLTFSRDDTAIYSSIINLSAFNKIRNLASSKFKFFDKLLRIGYYFLKGRYLPFKEIGNTQIRDIDAATCSILFSKFSHAVNSSNFEDASWFIDYSKDYFRWRFELNPVSKYRYMAFESNGKSIGCAVVNITNSSSFIITDILIPQQEHVSEVISSLLNLARSEGFSDLEFFGNIHHPYIANIFKFLASQGSRVKLNEYLRLVYKNVDENIFIPSKFYITGSWTEGYKI